MTSWDEVAEAALRFPDVVDERRSDGTRVWSVKAGGLAWERPLRASDRAALGASAPDGPILAIRTLDVAAKEELLVADPAVFFTTPHFDGYPAVLAQLGRLEAAMFEALFEEVWKQRAPRRTVRAWLAERSPNPTSGRP